MSIQELFYKLTITLFCFFCYLRFALPFYIAFAFLKLTRLKSKPNFKTCHFQRIESNHARLSNVRNSNSRCFNSVLLKYDNHKTE